MFRWRIEYIYHASVCSCTQCTRFAIHMRQRLPIQMVYDEIYFSGFVRFIRHTIRIRCEYTRAHSQTMKFDICENEELAERNAMKTIWHCTRYAFVQMLNHMFLCVCVCVAANMRIEKTNRNPRTERNGWNDCVAIRWPCILPAPKPTRHTLCTCVPWRKYKCKLCLFVRRVTNTNTANPEHQRMHGERTLSYMSLSKVFAVEFYWQ